MRRCARSFALLLACLAFLTPGAPGVAHAQTPLDDLLTKAAALTASGQHAEAYALLSSEEDTFIGDSRFDYVLGRAALHAGKPAAATIAFSRVLAVDPAHAGARIDSGRAYLALGNRAQAAVAFEELLAADPPPALRTQLLVYLAEAKGEKRRRLTARGYLEAFAGHSSNVNQAPAQGQVLVPVFGAQLQLADQNVRKSDAFAGVGAGIDMAYPMDDRYALIAGAEFLERDNRHESAFDVGGLSGALGVARSGEGTLARARWQSAVSTLGGRTSRKVQALSLDLSETASAPRPLGAFFGFASIGTFRHPSADLAVFDADFAALGAGLSRQIDEKSTIAVVLLAGEDRDRGGNPAGDRRGWGFRLIYDRAIWSDFRFQALFGRQDSDYSEVDQAFLVKREDRKLDLELTLRYKASRDWELRLGALRSVQDSSIPIYEYRRSDWTLAARYLFD